MQNNQSESSLSPPMVHVVDDDEAVLDAVGMLLDSIGQLNTCYKDAQVFLNAYNEPDFDKHNGCIVLDMRMPVISGIECQHRLEELGCSMPIIFVTGHGDIPTAVEAMKQGAVEFIQKPYREQQLIDAIQKALQINLKTQKQTKKVQQTHSKLALLTKRETQILEAVVSGKANKVIAIELHLSQRTVEIHRAHVMDKMEVKSLAELVKIVVDASPAE
ncbi:response regulator [uncultured Paraglaciecola sp.]|jgi:two-component system, LuxR family, response regulator FixJ|uniref:response regulator transcription factor n=1 Tax=uncultured Paraglaciecola sp. TaxID=1765024 RepID=UPI0025D9BD6D|nr:response regulator [uncultured Paraglaciecola sp.]